MVEDAWGIHPVPTYERSEDEAFVIVRGDGVLRVYDPRRVGRLWKRLQRRLRRMPRELSLRRELCQVHKQL